MSGAALLAGFAGDLALGDPRSGHPVAGLGLVSARLEDAVYAPSRRRGALFAGAVVGVTAAGAELLARGAARLAGPAGRATVLIAVTWAALGGRSLTRAARRLEEHVERGDVDSARTVLPWLCGRDAAALGADGLVRAAVESVAENTSDAVVGTLFWGAVAGPAGVAGHRAANTLDAMVGHRSERYRRFGWASARLDDVLNVAPARLTAGLTAACAPVVGGSPAAALRAVRRDGGAHPSPNAGRVEAAFAGALGVRLGGPLSYGGRAEIRPALGDGPAPTPRDLRRARTLSVAVGAAAALTCAAGRAALPRVRGAP